MTSKQLRKKIELNLSEKMFRSEMLKENLEIVQGLKTKNKADFYFAEDVKEFIKRLKEQINAKDDLQKQKWINNKICLIIDKLAGDKLI